MKRTIWAAVVILGVALAGSVVCGPYEDGMDAYKRQDYATALTLWKPLADQGNRSAQYNLATMYANGLGVPKDYPNAVKWFRSAADQGDASAQYNLGYMHTQGLGVPVSFVEGVKWYKLAAEQGHLEAQNVLRVMQSQGLAVSPDERQVAPPNIPEVRPAPRPGVIPEEPPRRRAMPEEPARPSLEACMNDCALRTKICATTGGSFNSCFSFKQSCFSNCSRN